MRTVSTRFAKANLSKLIDEAANGEAFIIAKGDRPMVRVEPLSRHRRLGFLAGQLRIPDDFDRMADAAMVDLFEGTVR